MQNTANSETRNNISLVEPGVPLGLMEEDNNEIKNQFSPVINYNFNYVTSIDHEHVNRKSWLKTISTYLEDNRHWITHPLHGGERGKIPILTGWQKYPTSKHIHSWKEDGNIGLICGPASRVGVFDVDIKDDGLAYWNHCLESNPEPQTYRVRTGSGGLHYYFNYDERFEILKNLNRAVEVNGQKIGWDLKGAGGQVVIPPSIHPNGNEYVIDNSHIVADVNVIDMPNWIFDIIAPMSIRQPIAPPPALVNPRVPAKPITSETMITPAGSSTPTGVLSMVPSPTKQLQMNVITEACWRELLSYFDAATMDFDPRRNLVWATASASRNFGHLAHEFYRNRPSYIQRNRAEEITKLFNNYDPKYKGSNGPITVGTAFDMLKETIGDQRYNSFRAKYGLNTDFTPRVKEYSVTYSPYDKYYLNDYIHQYNCVVGRCLETESVKFKETIMAKMKHDLLRVVHVIIGKTPIYVMKVDDEEKMFDLTTKNPVKTYEGYFAKIAIEQVNESGQRTFLKYLNWNIFSQLTDNIFSSQKMVMKPYHHFQENPVKYPNFNIFPGFKARVIDGFDPKVGISMEQYDKISRILYHILHVWARDDNLSYKFLMTWLAYPFRELKKTNIAISINGPQGVGKTSIFQLFHDYIYGKQLAIIGDLSERIMQNFNTIISGKMLIAVDEMGKIDKTKSYRGMFEKLKDMITGYIAYIEKKMVDVYTAENQSNISFASNNSDSIFIQPGDRRYGCFLCLDDVLGNKEYFAKYLACMNQECANILYSYMLSDQFKDLIVDLQDIPKTEHREEIIEANKEPIEHFIVDLFQDGAITIDSEELIKMKDGKAFIPSKYLWDLYNNWFPTKFKNRYMGDYAHWCKEFKNACKWVTHVPISKRPQVNNVKYNGYTLNESIYGLSVIYTIREGTNPPIGRLMTLRQWLHIF